MQTTAERITPTGPALYVLGGLTLRGVPDDRASFLTTQSKVVAMLAYLALAPSGAFTRRDRLAGILWPELDQPRARAALRKAIHTARSVLGDSVLVTRGDEDLAIAPASFWCDAAALRVSVAEGRLAQAIDYYRGDLLPGFHLTECHDFDVWLEEQRAAILEDVVAACWALAKSLESGRDYTDAGRYARKAARLDWSNERVLRRSLQMLDRLGDRASALRLYDDFVRRLHRELEAEPSQETVRLVESLRASPAS